MLSQKMVDAVINVKQAETDADSLIVSTALALAESEDLPVIVVGTDTDLLVMLVARATTSMHVMPEQPTDTVGHKRNSRWGWKY